MKPRTKNAPDTTINVSITKIMKVLNVEIDKIMSTSSDKETKRVSMRDTLKETVRKINRIMFTHRN